MMLMVPLSPGATGRLEYDALRHEHEEMTRVTTSGTVPSLVKVNSVDGRDVISVQGNSIDPGPRKVKTGEVKIKYKKDK